MPLVEEIPEIVRVTTTMVPALKNVQLIRGLLIPLSRSGTMNETKALEELKSARDKNQEQRTKLKKKYNKRVIKVSEAMKCVEDAIGDGKIAIAVGKAIISTITSSLTGNSSSAVDILFDKIAGCMIDKALQQRNKRRRGSFESHEAHKTGKKKVTVFEELVRVRRGKLHPHA
jgi:hypothetical protein